MRTLSAEVLSSRAMATFLRKEGIPPKNLILARNQVCILKVRRIAVLVRMALPILHAGDLDCGLHLLLYAAVPVQAD